MEEIRLKMFGSPDLSGSRTVFGVTGTPFTHVKTCRKFWVFPRKRV